MSEETKKEIDVQAIAQALAESVKSIIQEAKKPASEWQLASEPFQREEEKKKKEEIQKIAEKIKKPNDSIVKTKIEKIETGTFIDQFFYDENHNALNGLPFGVQLGIVGLPDVGKSILVQEIALRMASAGKKVVFVTSEDIWESPTPRFDLQSRMKQKADILGLDWEKIKENLYVIDTVTYSELRDWAEFVKTYRYLVEVEKGIDVLIVDSITLMEDYRGALKYRLMELARFNQMNGITGIFVCQRAIEETDKYAMAGGIGLAHNLDATICIDIKKASGRLKDELGKKQWELVHFVRVLGCRLCAFDRKYHEVEITDDGFLKLKGAGGQK